MDVTADELAGIVDLFGGLTRAELERALSEAAFRADGGSVDETSLEETLERALESFVLVRYEPPTAAVDETSGDAGEPDAGVDGHDPALYVAGPTAFPTVPDAAEDLPHILDLEPRRPDREELGGQVRRRYVREVVVALDAGDADRVRELLDASYDLEAWAPVELGAERERLDEALERS